MSYTRVWSDDVRNGLVLVLCGAGLMVSLDSG